MADNIKGNVIMESDAGYDMGKAKLGKLGRFFLTEDRLYIKKINQTVQTICMCVGVAVAIIIVNSIFGSTSRDYVGAALKGNLTGAFGAALGIYVSKFIPQQAGEVVFSASFADVVSVEDKKIGVRPVLEIAFKNGDICTAALPKLDEWKNALQSKENAGL